MKNFDCRGCSDRGVLRKTSAGNLGRHREARAIIDGHLDQVDGALCNLEPSSIRVGMDYKLAWGGGWLVAVPPSNLPVLRPSRSRESQNTSAVHV
ncbi:hypothetical protein [Cupriavidus sp. 8B]